MMAEIKFTKMVAAGNDFVVIDNRAQKIANSKLSLLAKEICGRKYGVGADGLLILEKSRNADVKMRIFNPDGSEPEMCGNGVRCAASYSARGQGRLRIQTRAGIIEAEVSKNKAKAKAKAKAEVKIKMLQPKDISLNFPIKINKRKITLNFINSGVPHAVIFVQGLDKIDVVNIGRQVRFHKKFLPQGTNVDFVQFIDDNNIRIRTYERGVEDETSACGTGVVAAALLSALHYSLFAIRRINVHTKDGEVLRVGFNRTDGKFRDVWLQGKANIVYSGVYYV